MGLPSLCPWARVSDPGGGHLEKLPLWALRSLSCEGLHPQVPPARSYGDTASHSWVARQSLPPLMEP